jgi:hypothetical protein
MSRRLREKRNKRANHVAELLSARRGGEGAGWDGMACSYGVHDFEHGEMFKTCRACGAVYFEAVGPDDVHRLEGAR